MGSDIKFLPLIISGIDWCHCLAEKLPHEYKESTFLALLEMQLMPFCFLAYSSKESKWYSPYLGLSTAEVFSVCFCDR